MVEHSIQQLTKVSSMVSTATTNDGDTNATQTRENEILTIIIIIMQK